MNNKNENWYEKLRDKFPILLEKCQYASVGIGWADLISSLCSDIQHLHDHKTQNGCEVPHPKVVQIKEKFGGLRFYMSGMTEEISLLVLDAENLSFKTCESCGVVNFEKSEEPSNNYWIKTLCKSCKIQNDLSKIKNS